ncbi:MAG TPA: signal peptide peptidase SppA [Hyphomicrobiaceae bacterium]|nr:signal peptide peptidase SppA [Hyphomicrobiaceae bacterium]
MSLETEAVLDRRRLRRHLSFWRITALIAMVLAVSAVAYSEEGGLALTERRQIARVAIEGMITEDRPQLAMLKRIGEANHVQGVLLYVNSPGGTTTGGEALYQALRALAAKKPVVAQFGTVAASAAYIAGLGADHIVARGNTITGSVGVIMQWPEVSELLDRIGVKMNQVKSGPLKATPSLFEPMDEAGRRVAEQMINDGHRWFLGLVANRRGIETAGVPGLEQGRVYSGREALQHKLVDEIGGEMEAIAWLEQKRNVPKNLKVVDWKPSRDFDWSWTGSLVHSLGAFVVSLGREATAALRADPTLGAIALDGLVSLWQPAKN